VAFQFNGILLIAYVGTDPQVLVDKYNTKNAQ
jgi:hypothetical protein